MLYHVKGIVERSIDGDEEDGVLKASVASTEVIDRMGEVIKQDGWQLKNFKKNPVLLWAHNAGLTEGRPPIGKVTEVWLDKAKRLMFSAKFDLEDTFAADIYRKFKKGFLNAFSVGFQPIDRDGNTYTKADLLEISAVPVPANPEALSVLRSMQPKDWNDIYPVVEDEVSKEVVAFKATPTLPEDGDWNKSDAVKRIKEWATEDGKINWKKYRQAFAWYDSSEPEKSSSYKMPHHDIDDNQLKSNWHGTAAAMAVLLGGRGGVNIPDADRKGVYDHLKKHYKQFDKDVPEFRWVEEQVMRRLETEYESINPPATAKEVKEIVKQEVKKEVKKTSPDAEQVVKRLEEVMVNALNRIKESTVKEVNKE